MATNEAHEADKADKANEAGKVIVANEAHVANERMR